MPCDVPEILGIKGCTGLSDLWESKMRIVFSAAGRAHIFQTGKEIPATLIDFTYLFFSVDPLRIAKIRRAGRKSPICGIGSRSSLNFMACKQRSSEKLLK